MIQNIVKIWNSAVAWTFLATALRLGGFVLVLPIVLRTLPTDQLGIWYLFITFSGFCVLLDMGFNPTFVRSTSYAWAGAETLLPHGIASLPTEKNRVPNLELLTKLVKSMRFFYSILGVAVLVFIGFGGGIWIWIKSAGLDHKETIRGAWAFFAIGLTFNTMGSFWPGLLVGINQVRRSQQAFLLGIALNYAVTVVGLQLGKGLWAMAAGNLVQAITLRAISQHYFLAICPLKFNLKGPTHHGIIKVLWPQAWRAGAGAFGAFLILQANTLICSARLSLAETASYGLSLQLITTLAGLSGTWLVVKAPYLNQLRIWNDVSTLRKLFFSRLYLALATFILGGLCLLLAGQPLLQAIGSKTHLLSFGTLALMLLFALLEMHHTQYATLVLSANSNPFVKPAIISGTLIALTSWFLVVPLGIVGIVISSGIVQLSFNNWWTVLVGLRTIRSTKEEKS